MNDRRLIWGLTAAGLGYAVVRYNVFKGVPWEQLPLFVSNKAIAFVGLLLLGLSRLVTDKRRRKGLGLAGAGFVAMHVLLSLMLGGPAYFPSFYDEAGQITGRAGLSLLAGALASGAVLWLLQVTGAKPLGQQRGGASLIPGLGRMLLVFTAVHVALIGVSGWFDVAAWPGLLPPITLLSFVVATAASFGRGSLAKALPVTRPSLMTNEKASSKAGRTLAMSDDDDAKSAAASALAQAGSPESSTSAEAASAAGRILSDPDATDRAKSAAGSALAQRDGDEDDDDEADSETES